MKKFEIPIDWHSHFNMIILDQVDSTNDEAKRIAESFTEGDFVVYSENQMAGRGRNGKEWFSPKGNLYLSILVRSINDLSMASCLPFIVSLTIGKFLQDHMPHPELIEFKWPNDVLYQGKKISGILIETKFSSNNRLEWIVIGCGLNIKKSPKDLSYQTISLEEITNKSFEIDIIIDEIMRNYFDFLEIYNYRGFEEIRFLWLQNAYGINKKITVNLHNRKIEGNFKGIDHNGSLIIELNDGKIDLISSGEVFFNI